MFGPTSRVILSERSESKGMDGESEEADKQEHGRDGRATSGSKTLRQALCV